MHFIWRSQLLANPSSWLDPREMRATELCEVIRKCIFVKKLSIEEGGK
jgi:hypothetical protein